MTPSILKRFAILLVLVVVPAVARADKSTELGLDATVIPAGSYGKVLKVTAVDADGRAGKASLPSNILITEIKGVVGTTERPHTIVSVADLDSYAAGKDAVIVKYVEITSAAAGVTFETFLGLVTGSEKLKRIQLKPASSGTGTGTGTGTTTTTPIDTARKHSSYLGLTANEVLTTKYKKVLNVSELDAGGPAATRATPALPKKFLIVGAVTVVDAQPFDLDQFSVTALNRLAAGRDSVRLEYIDITSFDPFAQNQEDFLKTALKKSSTIQLKGGTTPDIPPVTGPVLVTIDNQNPLKVYVVAKNYKGNSYAYFPDAGLLRGENRTVSIDSGTQLFVMIARNQPYPTGGLIDPKNHKRPPITVPSGRTSFRIDISSGYFGIYPSTLPPPTPTLDQLLGTWKNAGTFGGNTYELRRESGATRFNVYDSFGGLTQSSNFNYDATTGILSFPVNSERYRVSLSGNTLTMSGLGVPSKTWEK